MKTPVKRTVPWTKRGEITPRREISPPRLIVILALVLMGVCSCSSELWQSITVIEASESTNARAMDTSVSPNSMGLGEQSKLPTAGVGDPLDTEGVILAQGASSAVNPQILDPYSPCASRFSLTDTAELRRSRGHSGKILSVVPLSLVEGQKGKSSNILATDSSGRMLLWNLETGRALEFLTVPEAPDAMAYCGRYAAVAKGSKITLYALDLREEIKTFDRLDTTVTSLAFQPDGHALLLGGADGRVYRWVYAAQSEAASLKELEKTLERYIGHASVVSAVVYHPQARVFFSADWNGVLSAWLRFDIDPFGGAYDENVFGGRFFSERTTRRIAPRQKGEPIDRLIVSDDGRYLVLLDQMGRVELWQVRGFVKVAEAQAHKGPSFSLSMLSGAHRFVTAGRDGKVIIWDIKEEKAEDKVIISLERAKEFPLSNVKAVDFLDTERLVVGTSEGKILEVKIDV